jgi:hypothetical protein
MRTPPRPEETISPGESLVRGWRLFEALLVALGLCAAGLSLCWLFLLPGSTPKEAFARAVGHMVWIWPALMILVLPFALWLLEKKRVSSSHRGAPNAEL